MSISQRVIEILLRAKDETGAAHASFKAKQKEIQRETDETAKKAKDAGDVQDTAARKPLGGLESLRLGWAVAGAAVTAAAAAIVAATVKIVGSYINLVQSNAEVADGFDDLAQKTGTTASFLSALSPALEKADADVTALGPAIKRLTAAMLDQQQGVKETIDAWDRLGVSPMDAAGKMRSVQDVLIDVADGLAGITNESERMAVAQVILGRGALDLLPVLSQGSAALREQMDRAKELGAVLSDDFVEDAAAFVDAQTDMRLAWDGFKRTLTEPIQPAATAFVQDLTQGIVDLGGAARGSIGDLKQLQDSILVFYDAAKQTALEWAVLGAQIAQTTANAAGYGPTWAGVTTALLGGRVAAEDTGDTLRDLGMAQALVTRRARELTAALNSPTAESDAGLRRAIAATEDYIRALERQREAAEAAGQVVFAVSLGTELDQQRQALDLMKEGLAELGQDTADVSAEAVANLRALAAEWGVTAQALSVDLTTGTLKLKDKSPDQLAADVLAAVAAAAKIVEAGPPAEIKIPVHVLPSVDFKGIYQEQWDAYQKQIEEFGGLLDPEFEFPAPDPEAAETLTLMNEQMKALKESGLDVQYGMQNLTSTTLAWALSGQQGALMFGQMLKQVVAQAIADLIAKLIVAQAKALLLKAVVAGATGGGSLLFSQGGEIPGAAMGGMLPLHAAGGFRIPAIGARGQDSVPLMGMPGEYVLDRQLTLDLQAMITAWKSGQSFSAPPPQAAGGRGMQLYLNAGFPAGPVDAANLADTFVRAARQAERSVLSGQ